MAEASHSEDEILTCGICLEVFKEPKILPCLHRFCESCLSRHITESVSTTAAEQGGIPCPCCQSFTPAQNPTRPPSDMATNFETDFVIKELVSSRSRALAQVKYSCPIHKETVCEYYCVDCSRNLCQQCAIDFHRRCKVSRLTEAATDRKITLRPVNPVSKYLGSLEMADAYQNTVDVRENSKIRASNDDLPTIPEMALNKPNKISVLRTIDISCGDNSINVSGVIVVAPSNSIIVADWQNRVIMFTSNGDKCGNMRLSNSPWSIAQVSDNLLVVSLPMPRQICFIRMYPCLEVLSYIKCKHYMNLATLDTTTLVAASQACIDIIDTKGEVLKCFTNMINSDIPRVSSKFVCVSPDKMIIAYFPEDSRLVCLSRDGKTKFKRSKCNARYVACDLSGNIFLLSGNGLMTLTSDGKASNLWIRSTEKTLSNATCICVDNEGLVYVVNNNCKEIKVLSLVVYGGVPYMGIWCRISP